MLAKPEETAENDQRRSSCIDEEAQSDNVGDCNPIRDVDAISTECDVAEA